MIKNVLSAIAFSAIAFSAHAANPTFLQEEMDSVLTKTPCFLSWPTPGAFQGNVGHDFTAMTWNQPEGTLEFSATTHASSHGPLYYALSSGTSAACNAAQGLVDISTKNKFSIRAKASVPMQVIVYLQEGNAASWDYSKFSSSSVTMNLTTAMQTFDLSAVSDSNVAKTATIDLTQMGMVAFELGKTDGTNYDAVTGATVSVDFIRFGDTTTTTTGGGGGNGVACIETKDDGQAQATYYTLLETGASSVVTCSFDAVADIKGTFYGALETATLHGPGGATPAVYCGMCVSMTGIGGTHTVQITDECPDCHQHNTGDTDIDLSTPAFAAVVGAQSIGRSNITWKEIPCPWTNPLQVIVQGSNQWYVKVIIANHVNRIASVEVQQAGAWYHLTRGTDNGWVSTGVTTNELSKSFKITDIYGEVVTVSNLDFSVGNSKNYASVAPTNFPACGLSTRTEEVSLNVVSLYPNPSNNTITLEGLEDVQSLQIVNLSGQVIITEYLGGNTSTAGVDVSNLPSGIYVVKMTGSTTTGTVTFVKN